MLRTALSLAVALQLASPLAALAQTPTEDRSATDKTQTTAQTTSTQTTEAGRQTGEHVSSVAPEHPKEEGALFGECVSELAITGECPHEHDEE